ncbi:helix-turn-helix domain-containing protein [Streptomyces sp. NPDC001508]|uniref:helix-turn-helix domain-containing protein n=1 Tax=Streptomyces sp. NPDC001508 TaxID=3154656 RepID=UPI0033253588
MKAPQLLKPSEAARRLDVSRPTVYDIVAAGHLDVVTVGTGTRPGIRIPEESLARYIEARRVRARKPLRAAA